MLRVKFQGTDITDDSSAFSLSRFRQCLWPWKPKGTKGLWWYSCSTKVAVVGRGKIGLSGYTTRLKGPLGVDLKRTCWWVGVASKVIWPFSLASFHTSINRLWTRRLWEILHYLHFQGTKVWYPNSHLQMSYSWELFWQLRQKWNYNGWL